MFFMALALAMGWPCQRSVCVSSCVYCSTHEANLIANSSRKKQIIENTTEEKIVLRLRVMQNGEDTL